MYMCVYKHIYYVSIQQYIDSKYHEIGVGKEQR